MKLEKIVYRLAIITIGGSALLAFFGMYRPAIIWGIGFTNLNLMGSVKVFTENFDSFSKQNAQGEE